MPRLLNIYITTLLLLPLALHGQEQEQYKSELIGGLNFNTNANLIGGIMLKHSKQVSKEQYRFIGLEIVNVKHPKEQRVGSASTGNLFIYYKTHNLFALRTQYGREFILFHAAEEEGVQVNFIIAGGPTLGIVKPYMLEYDYGGYSQIEPADPDKSNAILGSGGILSGFNFVKVVPGINVKASFSLEFSQFKGSVTGIEIGGLLEAYTKHIPLIAIPSGNPQPYNANTFSSIFINIFFGLRR